MFPREHGAYGQLLFPLVTALAVGRPPAVAWLLAASVVAAFLAHEPLLVLLGQRGARAAREQRGRAAIWFGGSGIAAALCGVTAVVMSPSEVRIALIAPAALAAMLVVVIVWRQEHTTSGEVLSAVALSSMALPVAVAAGAPVAVALSCASVFAAVFVSGTLCVRAVIGATRTPPAVGARTVAGLIAAASVAVLWMLAVAGRASRSAPWAALPVCGGGLLLVMKPPSARHLRTIGWSLVATTTITAAALIATLR
jgi:hypothetical protein